MAVTEQITPADTAPPLGAHDHSLPARLPCPAGHPALLLSLEYAAATIPAYVCDRCLVVYRPRELLGPPGVTA
jgi:hypothetical protein